MVAGCARECLEFPHDRRVIHTVPVALDRDARAIGFLVVAPREYHLGPGAFTEPPEDAIASNVHCAADLHLRPALQLLHVTSVSPTPSRAAACAGDADTPLESAPGEERR